MVGWEVEDHLVLLEDEFFDEEVAGDASEGNGEDELFGGWGYGAETVGELLTEGVELLVGGEVVELLVELEAFADIGDVTVGDEDLEIGLDGAVGLKS